MAKYRSVTLSTSTYVEIFGYDTVENLTKGKCKVVFPTTISLEHKGKVSISSYDIELVRVSKIYKDDVSLYHYDGRTLFTGKDISFLPSGSIDNTSFVLQEGSYVEAEIGQIGKYKDDVRTLKFKFDIPDELYQEYRYIGIGLMVNKRCSISLGIYSRDSDVDESLGV